MRLPNHFYRLCIMDTSRKVSLILEDIAVGDGVPLYVVHTDSF